MDGYLHMIDLKVALEILAEHRGTHVVISTMTSAHLWSDISDSARDFVYLPSTMGQGPSLGLGLALAHPGQGVVVINGDGCMLMSLGCLVTIASHPANLFTVVIDNGVYELTGGQRTAGSNNIDYAGIAKASGIDRVYTFSAKDEWRRGAAEALSGQGPVFIHLRVAPSTNGVALSKLGPVGDRIKRLQKALSAPNPDVA